VSGFEAKYHGTCAGCHEHIEPGQMVRYVDDVLEHDNCDAEPGDTKTRGDVCAQCFMEKSLSGECSCTR
jgi:hypothetical protein